MINNLFTPKQITHSNLKSGLNDLYLVIDDYGGNFIDFNEKWDYINKMLIEKSLESKISRQKKHLSLHIIKALPGGSEYEQAVVSTVDCLFRIY